jgi:arylsulfatase A-like enzyme
LHGFIHDPYLPPEPFKGYFNSSPDLSTWKSQNRGHKIRQINIYKDRYDEFVMYVDSRFKAFINEFAKRKAFNNTVIILSADHGESFEHNYKGHGSIHLFEQVTHIPLIIKEPGRTSGRIIDDLVEQIDITPGLPPAIVPV